MESGTKTPQVNWKRRGGLSANFLKWLAIVAMTVDHIGWAFVPDTSALGIAMHFFGRITGITMFYFIVEGYHLTRNANRYTLRLALFAVVSYLPFVYFEYGTLPTAQHFYPFGVIYTLLLGHLCLRVRHEVRQLWVKLPLLLGLFLLSTFGDWPFFGVLFVLVFNLLRGSYTRQFLGGLALVAVQLVEVASYTPYLLINLGLVLPLLLLWFYNGERGLRGKVNKWFFYLYYPAHLVAIGLVRGFLYR